MNLSSALSPKIKSISSSIYNILVPEGQETAEAERGEQDALVAGLAIRQKPIDEPYQHDPISIDQIRLLVLFPLLQEEPYVSCNVITTNNGREGPPPPEYHALSYTWKYDGFDAREKPIQINGKWMTVGSNLWYALYQLSPSRGTRKLWVDAICIDQENVLERNDQVMQMGHIYSTAKNVIIWLGHEDGPTKRAFQTIEEFANPSCIAVLEPSENEVQKATSALSHFLDRQYWKRVWVIQEIVLAKSITIYSGYHMLQWSDLAKACRNRDGVGIPPEMAKQGLRLLQDSIAAFLERSRTEPETGRTLLNLLHACQDSHATDVRDMVYGLLGIANDSSFLEVDYKKSALELWQYLVKLQNNPPEGTNSYTFSGDKSTTMYFAQFLWDVLAISPHEIKSLPPSSPTLTLQGYWTDTIIQLGPLGSEIIAARRTTQVGNHHTYKDWRHELKISDPNWNLSVLQSVHLPTIFHNTSPLLAEPNPVNSATISVSDLKFANAQPRPKEARPWNPRPHAKLTRNCHFKRHLDPTDHEKCWDIYRFVVTEGGQIGWSHDSVRPGDLVCRFKETDIALLLRSRGSGGDGKFDVVGRIMLLRKENEQVAVRKGSKKAFMLSVPDLQRETGVEVDLQLGIQTLAYLACFFRPTAEKD
ncbi:hypothetical protein GLAREA_06463 [Glarea lozoyensis ATCC 20868]|uniref:Heterokaryon incompatibility domain-containing protein n=1 Tax=Glarea lozoyensis (strain ATCC 20868 / MF5171) TaxID=1116229 RepID=S3D6Q0_GLAL2|nr:uncharacterized protein GLAREA_06463 [Glarea lozoyensis ATCC 20868]EPE33450.1 hypothetical protein GLAREA_06463 [Glarea lozoyensis ATCC 20868]